MRPSLLSRLVNLHGGPDAPALRAAVTGRIIVVTGASFGIGEASARQLAAAGATVLLLARSQDRLEAIVAELRAQGGAAFAYPCDLADADAVTRVARQLLAEHGHVDVIVSNAGKSIRRSLAHSYQRLHDFRRTIDVNYLGPVQLLLALLPSMRARGKGQIVNVSTIGVRVPPAPRWGAYQASKGAFDVWLRSITPELRLDGVSVSTIDMALVHTRMSAPSKALYRHVPGLSAEQAGALVCRAIVEKPRRLAPWWVTPAEWLGRVAGAPLEAALAAHFRITGEGAGGTASLLRAAATEARRAGILTLPRPDRLPRMLAALRLGFGPAALAALAAAREPGDVAIIDERGKLDFGTLDARASALAAALAQEHGVGPGRGLAICCRNHRGFVEAVLAGSRLGADLLLLNTEFPGPQLAQALARQTIGAAVLDEEFLGTFAAAGFTGGRVLAWHEGTPSEATIDALVARDLPAPPPPRRPGKIIMLTSGTTGVPKGAPRTPTPETMLGPLATLLGRLQLRTGEPILVGPPLFHGFGLAYLGLALLLRAPLVLRRRFDAEALLADAARERVATMVGVPVMLQRLLDVPARHRFELSALRRVVSSGAPLPAALATSFMDGFGDLLYNLYGSTETGFVSIATPADLRAAPGTVGRAPLGVNVGLLDAEGAKVPAGATGRIFVGSAMTFAGYSDGGSKQVLGGLMSTGDVGHIDGEGRLFVDGREDDMIVSGGENVFPQEVEELLAGHEHIADAAVIGVADAEFGQRLRAFVVPRAGHTLSVDELKAFVRRHVARYKVPRDVVVLAELPRNPTGKLLRSQLPRS